MKTEAGSRSRLLRTSRAAYDWILYLKKQLAPHNVHRHDKRAHVNKQQTNFIVSIAHCSSRISNTLSMLKKSLYVLPYYDSMKLYLSFSALTLFVQWQNAYLNHINLYHLSPDIERLQSWKQLTAKLKFNESCEEPTIHWAFDTRRPAVFFKHNSDVYFRGIKAQQQTVIYRNSQRHSSENTTNITYLIQNTMITDYQ